MAPQGSRSTRCTCIGRALAPVPPTGRSPWPRSDRPPSDDVADFPEDVLEPSATSTPLRHSDNDPGPERHGEHLIGAPGVELARVPVVTAAAATPSEMQPLVVDERRKVDVNATHPRSRDDKFAAGFDRVANGAGARVLSTAGRAPLVNAVCERFLGSVRRECLDHIVILSEAHLRHVLREYARSYFNAARPHHGIGQRIPLPPSTSEPRSPVRSPPPPCSEDCTMTTAPQRESCGRPKEPTRGSLPYSIGTRRTATGNVASRRKPSTSPTSEVANSCRGEAAVAAINRSASVSTRAGFSDRPSDHSRAAKFQPSPEAPSSPSTCTLSMNFSKATSLRRPSPRRTSSSIPRRNSNCVTYEMARPSAESTVAMNSKSRGACFCQSRLRNADTMFVSRSISEDRAGEPARAPANRRRTAPSADCWHFQEALDGALRSSRRGMASATLRASASWLLTWSAPK